MLIRGLVLGLHSVIDRTEREKRKQAKLNNETRFQQERVATRKAAGKLARTKAKADGPIRTKAKHTTSTKKEKRK